MTHLDLNVIKGALYTYMFFSHNIMIHVLTIILPSAETYSRLCFSSPLWDSCHVHSLVHRQYIYMYRLLLPYQVIPYQVIPYQVISIPGYIHTCRVSSTVCGRWPCGTSYSSPAKLDTNSLEPQRKEMRNIPSQQPLLAQKTCWLLVVIIISLWPFSCTPDYVNYCLSSGQRYHISKFNNTTKHLV